MARAHGYHHTEETREKIRDAMRGRKYSEETLKKMRAAAAKRDYRGDKNPCWRGGAYLARGRVMEYVSVGVHVPRSRLNAEATLGRPLTRDEDAHHKNGRKDDDSQANLDVLSHHDHARLHAHMRPRDQRTKRWL